MLAFNSLQGAGVGKILIAKGLFANSPVSIS
jgi:hypothetical protein